MTGPHFREGHFKGQIIKRLSFSVFDRLVFVDFYLLFPKICDALAIVKPDTALFVGIAPGTGAFRSWADCTINQLPRNPLGKVLKRELRETASDLIKRDLLIEAGKV